MLLHMLYTVFYDIPT